VKYAASSQLPSTGNIGEQAFVEETNRLYIWNGSGWYNIALINTTPTWDANGQPNATYELSSDSPQTATTITLAASDPEGVSINYSYVTGGSMDSIATVSQDSSVFTITPKTSTQAPDGGTGSITFRASDGINILPQVSSFTLNFISIVENSRYTTLLATATGTSDNNNITDSSSNNHTITVNGDAHTGTFSPYRSGGYSFYGHFRPETVSGTLDTYSLSFWYKLNSVIDNARVFETQSGSFSMMIETDNSGQFSVGGAFETQNDGSGNNYLDNNWHYFVVSRTPSETNWYMDGAQITTARNGSTITTTLSSLTAQAVRNMTFGGRDASSDLGSLPTTNLADINFRDIELKSTTHDGSVPTEPVTSSSDTVFLTAHKPYGAYEYGATPTSAPIGTLGTNFETRSTSPYDNLEYASADHGGSVYFVGGADYSSQYLSLSGPSMPSGDFTLSTWAYLTHTVNDNKTLFDFNGNSGGFRIMYANGTTGTPYHFRFYTAGGTVYLYDSTSTHPTNQWHYIVVIRDSGTFKLYVNNVLIATSTANPTFSSSNNIRIGQAIGGSGTVEGYLSDIIYNPTTAITDFTPPTAPLSSTGAALHIKGADASIIDKSQGSNLKLVGNTTGSTTQAKFSNTKSMYFDGTGDYITNLPDDLFAFGYDPYTVEFWIYTASYPAYSNRYHIFGSSTSAGNKYAVKLSTQIDSGSSDGDTNTMSSTCYANMPTAGNWVHVAFVRTGIYSNQCKCYINGSQGNQETDNKEWGTATDNTIGATASGNYGFNGYIQDLRVTKGLARYTSNFIPPAAPLEG
jgi:hypothetical protein